MILCSATSLFEGQKYDYVEKNDIILPRIILFESWSMKPVLQISDVRNSLPFQFSLSYVCQV